MAGHLGDPFGEFLPKTKIIHKTTTVERYIDGHNIDYWHQFTINLKKGVADLINDRDEAVKVAIERKANDAGLRAVIRQALAVIQETNPNHTFLDKKIRDRLFHEHEKAELERLFEVRGKGETEWHPKLRPAENQSE
jgi:hypothetical protein